MKRILIVEDDFLTRKMLNQILQKLGAVDVAANGIEAIEGFRHGLENGKPYDLIFLDITMPDVDGITVLKQIRKVEEEIETPEEMKCKIIMVTGRKDQLMSSFHSGCDGYVLKPFSPQKILEKAKETLSG